MTPFNDLKSKLGSCLYEKSYFRLKMTLFLIIFKNHPTLGVILTLKMTSNRFGVGRVKVVAQLFLFRLQVVRSL